MQLGRKQQQRAQDECYQSLNPSEKVIYSAYERVPLAQMPQREPFAHPSGGAGASRSYVCNECSRAPSANNMAQGLREPSAARETPAKREPPAAWGAPEAPAVPAARWHEAAPQLETPAKRESPVVPLPASRWQRQA